VYSSYYPAHTVGGYLDSGKVWVEEMRYPAEWDFGWQGSILMVLSLPAILLAIPLLLTVKKEDSIEEILKITSGMQEASKTDRELNKAISDYYQLLVLSLASLVEVLFERDPELQKSYDLKYRGKVQAQAAQGNPAALDLLADIVRKFGGGKTN